jgi:hypothetical protein
MWPSSRFALSLKPSVAYLVLNFCALWKKQTTFPFLAYAGIPYQVFGERAGALALMIAWSRSAMARSGCGSAAIFASTALSPSAWAARRSRRASAFNSWRRSLIATRSSSVNPARSCPVVVVLLGNLRVPFFAGFIVLSFATRLSTPRCFAYSISNPCQLPFDLYGQSIGGQRSRLTRSNCRVGDGPLRILTGPFLNAGDR